MYIALRQRCNQLLFLEHGLFSYFGWKYSNTCTAPNMSRHLECVAMFLFMDIIHLKFLASDHLLNVAVATLLMLFFHPEHSVWAAINTEKFVVSFSFTILLEMLVSEISKGSKQNHPQCMMGEFMFSHFIYKVTRDLEWEFKNQSRSRSQMTDVIILANHMPWHTRVSTNCQNVAPNWQ